MSLNLGQHVTARSPRSPRRQADHGADTPSTFKIDPHVEKKIAPLVAKIRDLALRRGDGAFRDVGYLLGVGRGAANNKGRRGYKPTEVVKMNPDAFKLTIAQFGIVLTTADVDMLLSAFKDSVGYLVVSHLMAHLSNTMDATRQAVVQRAFMSLPIDAEGLVDVSAMLAQYHPQAHPLVVSGQATADNVLRQFGEAFDPSPAANKAPNGKVSFDEFNAYYAGISYGIADTEAFVDMVRGLWDLYERPPPPPKERCFVPSANTCDNGRYTMTNTNASRPLPHTIVGYTGHIPGACEHFGESFAATQTHTANISLANKKERYVPQAGEHVDAPLSLRETNRANKHNFSLA